MGKGDRYAKFSLSGGKSTMPERPCFDKRQAQCVLFSLTYQCGTKGAERRGPVTISAMRRGDWRKASAALRDRNGWKGEYVGRRYQEGTLLMEVC